MRVYGERTDEVEVAERLRSVEREGVGIRFIARLHGRAVRVDVGVLIANAAP